MKLLLALLLLATPVSAQVEARSLASSGTTLYVGTSAGAIYSSTDGGRVWRGFTAFRNDYVIDRMLVAGDRFYAAAWVLGSPDTGMFFASADAGKTWTGTLAKPVRAIAASGDTLIVGALDGVYRSRDGGMTFDPISTGIKDVQSVAVDSENPNYIFVGTWHLGYYTHDGGAHWHTIAKGIINDSDFFAIVLDHETVYIGACSGIYKGSDDGQQYSKMKTKSEARRTKVIRQVSPNVLYAGTTDGIWITTDAGKVWTRRGNHYIVVNDMLATSPNHLVVATSRYSVIWSDDGGKTFTESQF